MAAKLRRKIDPAISRVLWIAHVRIVHEHDALVTQVDAGRVGVANRVERQPRGGHDMLHRRTWPAGWRVRYEPMLTHGYRSSLRSVAQAGTTNAGVTHEPAQRLGLLDDAESDVFLL